jgi:hypothetical protein
MPPTGAPSEKPQITNIPEAMLNTFPRSTLIDNGSHYIKVDKEASVKLFNKGTPLSGGRYGRTTGKNDDWERQRGSLNLNLAYQDKQ